MNYLYFLKNITTYFYNAGYIQQYLVMKKKLTKPVDWSGNIDVYSTGQVAILNYIQHKGPYL